MSSLIDASESLGHETLNGDADSRIIHFDATQRRKEKMRRKSHDAPQNAEPVPEKPANSEPESAEPDPVQPTRQQPTASAPERKPEAPESPPPSAAKKSATLDAYSSHAPAPAATALSRLSGPELEQFLIDFVVEQTGYPPEMVELDADLEADLGIDSIKKAQLFGELAERFEITVDVTDESLSLDDFPTLGHVMEFLKSRSGDAASAEASTAAPSTETADTENADAKRSAATETVRQTPAAPSVNGAANGAANGQTGPSSTPAAAASEALAGVDLETFLVDFVVEQTGYPSEMVELDADLEADLGIDSIKKAQLFGELAEQFEITVDVTDESLSLDDFPTLRHVMEFLQSAGSDVASSAKAPAESVEVLTDPAQAASHGTSANGASSPNPSAAAAEVENPSAEPEPSDTSSALNLGQEELETFLVNFVVEQTGYPPEMVELDADLEADLGIDSIKKAQMMGELAEQFEITVDVTDDNLSLDDFPTLRHVCEFLAAPGKVSA